MSHPDNRPNVPCPHPECFKGSVDTGREDERTGEPITKLCPFCGGSGFLTAEANDHFEWCRSEASRDFSNEDRN